LTNLLLRVLKRLKFWLFEERDDLYAKNPKRRRQLHNAYLIQTWTALTGIIVILMVPLFVWLISLQGFVIGYVIFSIVAFIFYTTISLYIRHLNKQFEIS